MADKPRKKKRFLTLKNKRTMPLWIAKVIAWLLRAVRKTYRISYLDSCGLLDSPPTRPVIFVLWHNRILFLGDCFPLHLRQRAAVLISASRDGEYASTIIRFFGMEVVRGSSSRHAFRAVREMMRKLENGTSLVVTLDGPRGPRYMVHHGAAAMAMATGAAIVPISLNARRRWDLKSWDGTQIPVPFSSVQIVVGEPLNLQDDAGSSKDETAVRLREALMAVTDDAR